MLLHSRVFSNKAHERKSSIHISCSSWVSVSSCSFFFAVAFILVPRRTVARSPSIMQWRLRPQHRTSILRLSQRNSLTVHHPLRESPNTVAPTPTLRPTCAAVAAVAGVPACCHDIADTWPMPWRPAIERHQAGMCASHRLTSASSLHHAACLGANTRCQFKPFAAATATTTY